MFSKDVIKIWWSVSLNKISKPLIYFTNLDNSTKTPELPKGYILEGYTGHELILFLNYICSEFLSIVLHLLRTMCVQFFNDFASVSPLFRSMQFWKSSHLTSFPQSMINLFFWNFFFLSYKFSFSSTYLFLINLLTFLHPFCTELGIILFSLTAPFPQQIPFINEHHKITLLYQRKLVVLLRFIHWLYSRENTTRQIRPSTSIIFCIKGMLWKWIQWPGFQSHKFKQVRGFFSL